MKFRKVGGQSGVDVSGSRLLGWLWAAVAVVSLLIAVFALKWYLWDVAIGRAGEPDRSLLFWGLPIFFIGVSAMGGAIGFALLSRSLLSRRGVPDPGKVDSGL